MSIMTVYDNVIFIFIVLLVKLNNYKAIIINNIDTDVVNRLSALCCINYVTKLIRYTKNIDVKFKTTKFSDFAFGI